MTDMNTSSNPFATVSDKRFENIIAEQEKLVKLIQEIDLAVRRAKELRIQNKADEIFELSSYKTTLKQQLTQITLFFKDSDITQIVYEAMNDKQY